jgi:hypothetical protein
MARHGVGAIATTFLTFAVFTSQPSAAQLAAPKKTSTTTKYDHYPPVTGYIVQLTPDELNTVQGFHQQHVEAFQNFTKGVATPKATVPPSPAPIRTTTPCTKFDNFPPVCGYKVQLTPDELKTVQGFHQQHVEAYENFKNTSK